MLQGNVENFSPQVIRQIAKEIADLQKVPPEGIKIHPNEEDLTDIRATLEGPGIHFVFDKYSDNIPRCIWGYTGFGLTLYSGDCVTIYSSLILVISQERSNLEHLFQVVVISETIKN